jgi:hypothetical protein
MNMIKNVLLFALIVASSGCIMYPAKAIVHYGVKGTIVDTATDRPLAKSPVAVTVDGRQYNRKTNRHGRFRIPPETDWYWTWTLCGPVYPSAEQAIVQAEIEGYERFQTVALAKRPWAQTNAVLSEVEGTYLLLDRIKMERCQPEN